MFARLMLVVIACVALGGVPAHADSSNPWALPHAMNWYGYHSGYMAHCYMQVNGQDQWGRERQYDSWCKNNARYRYSQPDRQWTSENPWDHGHQGDRPQGH